MSPARTRTWTARSGVERTDHEATAPFTSWTQASRYLFKNDFYLLKRKTHFFFKFHFFFLMSLENQEYSNDKGQRNQRRKIRNYHYSLRLYYKKQNQAKGMYWNIVDKMGYAPDRRLERDKWVKYKYKWIWKIQSKILLNPHTCISCYFYFIWWFCVHMKCVRFGWSSFVLASHMWYRAKRKQ